MKKYGFSLFKTLAAVTLALAACLAGQAQAATTNYVAATPVVLLPFHLSGQYTATEAGVVKIVLPYKAKLIAVSATAAASGGTTPTLTVDVLKGGVSVLSAPIAITAGTVADGTIATSAVADESTVTVNIAITGTNPTWNDITVLITLIRL